LTEAAAMMLGYARVSTEEQAQANRSSLKDQEQVVRGIAMTRGISGFDFALFQDPGVSGSIPLSERPAGRQLLETAKHGDIVAAAKLDRMFRTASDALVTAEKMKQDGIDLILFDLGADPVTSNGMAKFFFTMVSAFAELERVKISERMAVGRNAKKARGGHIGGLPPFGFRKVGHGRDATLVPDPEEQDVLALARSMTRSKFIRRPYQIAKALNDMGVRTRTGHEFQTVQIQRMLKQVEHVSG
jgi:DNA invertase Pin-like site-specific DNA recombinase